MREIKKTDFKVTEWSGGKTTELYILPEGADFSKRDFDFRISSASFTGTSSNFSDFSGYQRYILPLQGFIDVKYEGLYDHHLEAFEAEYFDGRWKTYSENSLDTLDYNFIVKNGSNATMEIVREAKEVKAYGYKLYVFSPQAYKAELNGEVKEMNAWSLYIIEEDFKITDLKKPIIICKYK